MRCGDSKKRLFECKPLLTVVALTLYKSGNSPDNAKDLCANCGLFRRFAIFSAFAPPDFLRIPTCHYPTARTVTPNIPTKITACSSARMRLRMERCGTRSESDELIIKDANGNLLADGVIARHHRERSESKGSSSMLKNRHQSEEHSSG